MCMQGCLGNQGTGQLLLLLFAWWRTCGGVPLTLGGRLCCRWLAPTVLAALVQLLAAVIVKPGGKVKQAQEHICRGEANTHQTACCVLTRWQRSHLSLQQAGGGGEV